MWGRGCSGGTKAACVGKEGVHPGSVCGVSKGNGQGSKVNHNVAGKGVCGVGVGRQGHVISQQRKANPNKN